jgi:hypothetical protein
MFGTHREKWQVITARPVYEHHRRSLRQMWGVFAHGVLTVITLRYPSKLMQDLLSGDPRNSRDPMKYEGRDWKVQP